MSADEYLQSVIAKYHLPTGYLSPAYQVGLALHPTIKEWAAENLLDIAFSGSFAKDTAMKGGSDVDLFVSLSPYTAGTLGDVYYKLVSYLKAKGYAPRPQNVSVGIVYSGHRVDIVPARKLTGNTSDHALYKSKSQTWKKTNIMLHVKTVKESGRLDEIRAMKVWRNLHQLEFPSFYLELCVIDALYYRNRNQLANNVWTTLDFLSSTFPNARFVDPANSNNVISDDLTSIQKQAVASAAATSLTKKNWAEIIW